MSAIPHPHPHAELHRSQRSPWLRAAVLGANDGVVSTAAIIVGVAGSGAAYSEVRTAGIAGLVAGAMSMAAGEYVSVASQRDAEAADLRIEAAALREHPRAELAELTDIWEARGLAPGLAREVAVQLTEADALAAHARDELGLSEERSARPLQASLTSALAFTAGAAMPLLAYLLAPQAGRSATVVAVALLALGVFGAVGAALGGAGRLRGTIRVTIGGAAAMAVTMAIGELTGAAVG
jgi:vacuolar iron transporter family protein